MTAFTKTLLTELTDLLKSGENTDAIIERLEKLEKNIVSEEKKELVEKYESINHHILLGNKRYKLEPLKVLVAPDTYVETLTFVEQKMCCMDSTEENRSLKCCIEKEFQCDICPFRTGKINTEATNKSEPLLRTADLSAPINLNRNKKPCEGCDCGLSQNITLDIEDIAK